MSRKVFASPLIVPATDRPPLHQNPFSTDSIEWRFWERARAIILFRVSLGMSQADMAARCNTSPSTWSRIERNGWVCQRVIRELITMGMDESELDIKEM